MLEPQSNTPDSTPEPSRTPGPAATARTAFATVEDARDQLTADLLTQRLQIHEKTAWMLRSMLA